MYIADFMRGIFSIQSVLGDCVVEHLLLVRQTVENIDMMLQYMDYLYGFDYGATWPSENR